MPIRHVQQSARVEQPELVERRGALPVTVQHDDFAANQSVSLPHHTSHGPMSPAVCLSQETILEMKVRRLRLWDTYSVCEGGEPLFQIRTKKGFWFSSMIRQHIKDAHSGEPLLVMRRQQGSLPDMVRGNAVTWLAFSAKIDGVKSETKMFIVERSTSTCFDVFIPGNQNRQRPNFSMRSAPGGSEFAIFHNGGDLMNEEKLIGEIIMPARFFGRLYSVQIKMLPGVGKVFISALAAVWLAEVRWDHSKRDNSNNHERLQAAARCANIPVECFTS